jgi:hypothetical protein
VRKVRVLFLRTSFYIFYGFIIYLITWDLFLRLYARLPSLKSSTSLVVYIISLDFFPARVLSKICFSSSSFCSIWQAWISSIFPKTAVMVRSSNFGVMSSFERSDESSDLTASE